MVAIYGRRYLKIRQIDNGKKYYPFYGAKTDTLVIHCSDYRFRKAFGAFIKENFGTENYDSLVIPGASQILSFMNFLPIFSVIFEKFIKFLVEKHGIKRMIIVMHEDCAWYHCFVPKYFSIKVTEKEHQISDMLSTKRWAIKNFPDIAIEMFYASIVENEAVTFSKVE
ncbi:MAG: hypothetical protein Q7R84_02440 [bacterium]|nr:hypothetical protein [bacterium]